MHSNTISLSPVPFTDDKVQLTALIIEDCSRQPEALLADSICDIQSSLSNCSTAKAAVSEFLKSTRSKFGFGQAASLLVDLVNQTRE